MSDNQISINNLSKIYDNGFEALKNINLEIKKGEIHAIMGTNGSGKSTLSKVLTGPPRAAGRSSPSMSWAGKLD